MLRVYLSEEGKGLSTDLGLEEAIGYRDREGFSIWVDVLRDPELELIRRDEAVLELDIFLGQNCLVTIHKDVYN